MRIAFIILVFLHGLLHLFGFAKAYSPDVISHIRQPISKGQGMLWLTAAVLFVIVAIQLYMKNEGWWKVALLGIVLSQYLVFGHWQIARFGSIANALVLFAIIVSYSAAGLVNNYKRQVSSLIAQSNTSVNGVLTERDMQDLPIPVQKYLHQTGAVGRPKVKWFRVVFSGQIRKDKRSEWMPFTSEQYNFMDTPTRLFFMKANMFHLPVAGFHSYRNTHAFMDIRLLSLFRVQYQEGRKMGIAETVTFFNDMCCMAPATLIDKRIKWLETDGNKVKASFTTNYTTISAWLYFSDNGDLVNFASEDRYASIDGDMKQLPWATPLSDYRSINGYRLPGYAETIYTYPTGDLCYGRFHMVDVSYNHE